VSGFARSKEKIEHGGNIVPLNTIHISCEKITFGHNKIECVLGKRFLDFDYYKKISFFIASSSKTYTYKLIKVEKTDD
jgi:hypothetical protein